jgi:hypothetical protein
MFKKTVARLIIIALIASTVGGTWLIVARFGSPSDGVQAGFIH